MLRLFDFPDPNATSPMRDYTTIAPQALFLMNHAFVINAANAILSRPGGTPSSSAYGRCFGGGAQGASSSGYPIQSSSAALSRRLRVSA